MCRKEATTHANAVMSIPLGLSAVLMPVVVWMVDQMGLRPFWCTFASVGLTAAFVLLRFPVLDITPSENPIPAMCLLVSRPFPSWNRSILTEIYLCHACSYHEVQSIWARDVAHGALAGGGVGGGRWGRAGRYIARPPSQPRHSDSAERSGPSGLPLRRESLLR